ncbi:PIN-like domain-containing protein [Janthinobacterium sp. SUN100]|uniref:PIN-like domain-containing protein n=1 Tax=Janthinobacterium sp. SUN100 TaxID=3004101 RepID=UPI0025B17F27|nr:PIN-like domain-containing protein [Janthinobacterium sp. SUN100]MDN2701500.1 PIN-like domain-containing protein [Janthinobacterium sp. SUN100]
MKKLFPGHYRPSEEAFKSLWTNGLFVFDTNVLLNLYSYPEAAREIFFSVLNRVAERSWIPYQVALEFHRNKFTRIKKSNEPLLDLRDRIRENSASLEAEFLKIEFEKRNTGIVDLHDRLSAVRDSNIKLAEAIDLACVRLPSVSLDDPIGNRIAELFSGRVGEPPADQEALDILVKDGQDRYDKRIPPGYKDAKDKRDLHYRDRGITYAGMFGDLILWRQTTAFVAKNGNKDVVFITGDGKDDWWSSHEGKTLGPAPELIQEFLTLSGAERFWIYRADQFLKNAEQYLKAKEVTEETIAQVKETAEYQQSEASEQSLTWENLRNFQLRPQEEGYTIFDERLIKSGEKNNLRRDSRSWMLYVESIVTRWAKTFHRSDKLINMIFPDIVIEGKDGLHGYEIISPRGLKRRVVQELIRDVSTRSKEVPIDNISIVVAFSAQEFVDLDERALDRYANDILNMLFNTPIHSVIIGYIVGDEFHTTFVLKSPIFLANQALKER